VLKGKNMSTYTRFLYQLVFASKDHVPFLSSANQDILFAYIAGVLKNQSCHSYIVDGAVNHIHIITHIHPTINYVKNQAEHHKTVSFKDELLRLLKEHSVDYKEEYLFT
jgi:hypothetical protein